MPTETLTTNGLRAAPMPSREPTAHTSEEAAAAISAARARGARRCSRDGGCRGISGGTRPRRTVGRVYARRRDGRRAGHIRTRDRTISCAILLVTAVAILARVREGPLKGAPGKLVTALAWFTTIYAVVAVILNLATRSSSERAVFAPTAILLFVLVVTVMVGSRRARSGA